MKLKLSGQIL